jgi:hypothetical protein
MLTCTAGVQPASATGVKEAGASLLIPTYGQSMNNETYKTKTKIMAGVEFAAITTTAVLATVSSGGTIWIGLGPLIANHVWSSADAYKGAQIKKDPAMKQQLLDAQRSLELSRQSRYSNEQGYRMSLRDRILQAGQQAK